MFLLKLPKSKWYCDLFITLDDGYKTTTPLRFIEVQSNDDKTQKVIFTKLDNEEIVELLVLNNMEVTLKQDNYYISHVGKYMYGYKFCESRMLRQKIMLPVNSAGEPDYKYMENYTMKNTQRTNHHA